MQYRKHPHGEEQVSAIGLGWRRETREHAASWRVRRRSLDGDKG